MPLPEDESLWKKLLIIFVTANGNVRKNSLDDFEHINANGKIAMKLETNIRAPKAGIIKELVCEVGDRIESGDLLFIME